MTRTRAVLLTAALLALVPAGTADAKAKPPCSLKGSKTVAQNKYARVFTVQSHREDYGDVLYGCMKSVGKRLRLAEDYDDGLYSSSTFSQVVLNRRFVAWQVVSSDVSCKAACPPDYQPTTYTVGVRDLRASRSRGFANGQAKDGTLVVGIAGTPAWLQDATGGAVEVHAGGTVVDSGAIDSLTLKDTTLGWLNAGQPKSATLR